MKKLFLFAAAVCAALTVNAQEPVVKYISELCNYVNFSEITTAPTVPTSDPSTWYTFDNGAVCKGFQKSDGSEAANTWNVKEEGSYNTFPIPDVAEIDSVKWGTVFRAASGSSVELGRLECPNGANIQVYFQPNGTSSRGLGILLNGEEVAQKLADNSDKNIAYVVEYTLPAGTYAAGAVVVKVLSNTVNIAGINVDRGSEETGLNNTTVAPKAQKVMENGQLIIIRDGVKYNALGAVVE